MSRDSALRPLLLSLAMLFLAWEAYGALRWVVDAGGLGAAASRFRDSLTHDWMLLVVVTDHLMLAGLVLVLMWLDTARAGWQSSRRLLLVAAFVALGSPIVLGYLAWRLGVMSRPMASGSAARV